MRKRQYLSSLLYAIILLVFSSPTHAAEFTLIAVGDVLPFGSWQSYEVPASELFKGVSARFYEADIVIGNLEEPLTSRKEMTPVKDPKLVRAGRDFVLKAQREETAKALSDAGFTVLTLANNHILDYREDGLLDTLSRLKSAGIITAGAGASLAEAETPVLLKAGGMDMLLFAVSDVVPKTYGAEPAKPGIASIKDPVRLLANLKRAREINPDSLIIVSVHWGVEATYIPSPRQVELAHKFIDEGADLVIGHHPHRVQGVEIYNGRPIFYSLGNFQFDTRGPGNESVMAVLKYDGRREPASLEIVPVAIGQHGAPRLPAEGEPRYQAIMKNVAAMGKDLGTEYAGRQVVFTPQADLGKGVAGLASHSVKRSYY